MIYQRDNERTLALGIVGVGQHAYRNILPALNYLPVTLRAICDLNPQVAARTARQYGVPNTYTSTAEMYENEDLDAVLLCVSHELHPRLAIEAFGQGLHVWMEKPPAMRTAEVAEMIRHRGDRVCVVGFKKMFMPAAGKVREILADPRYGPVQSMAAIYPIARFPWDGREVLEKRKSTSWLKNGCHPLALLLDIGGPVDSVALFQGERQGAACLLRFENGSIGNLHLVDNGTRGQPLERYSFFGNACHVEVENSLRVTFQRGMAFDYGSTVDYTGQGLETGAVVWEPQNHLSSLENKAVFTQGVHGELLHFCECALGGRPAERGTLEFAHEVMKVYEAALLSAGNWVALAEGERAANFGEA